MGNSELWERLRAARKYADLRQQDIAVACTPAVNRAAVAQWEDIARQMLVLFGIEVCSVSTPEEAAAKIITVCHCD